MIDHPDSDVYNLRWGDPGEESIRWFTLLSKDEMQRLTDYLTVQGICWMILYYEISMKGLKVA